MAIHERIKLATNQGEMPQHTIRRPVGSQPPDKQHTEYGPGWIAHYQLNCVQGLFKKQAVYDLVDVEER